MIVQTMHPVEHTARRIEHDRLKNRDKHHIFAPTAGTHSTISPKLCMMIEDVKTIKKVGIIFDPTQFFLQGARKNLG